MIGTVDNININNLDNIKVKKQKEEDDFGSILEGFGVIPLEDRCSNFKKEENFATNIINESGAINGMQKVVPSDMKGDDINIISSIKELLGKMKNSLGDVSQNNDAIKNIINKIEESLQQIEGSDHIKNKILNILKFLDENGASDFDLKDALKYLEGDGKDDFNLRDTLKYLKDKKDAVLKFDDISLQGASPKDTKKDMESPISTVNNIMEREFDSILDELENNNVKNDKLYNDGDNLLNDNDLNDNLEYKFVSIGNTKIKIAQTITPLQFNSSSFNNDVIGKIKMAKADGANIIKINVAPVSMGAIEIHLKISDNNVAQIHFVSNNQATREIINASLDYLEKEFSSSGFSFEGSSGGDDNKEDKKFFNESVKKENLILIDEEIKTFNQHNETTGVRIVV